MSGEHSRLRRVSRDMAEVMYNKLCTLYDQLIESGVRGEIGDLLAEINELSDSTEGIEYIEAARENYGVDGDLEFDDYPVVSMGDDQGAYVQCWKWIPGDEAEAYLDHGRFFSLVAETMDDLIESLGSRDSSDGDDEAVRRAERLVTLLRTKANEGK